MAPTPPVPATQAAKHPPKRQKVPPFARYEGTSAWKKDRRRASEYARFKAARAASVGNEPASA